jgi:3-isopropylmalate/(R)-2-methylmalate dehydratase small subunit
MTHTPFTVVTGPAIPLLRANIDTDTIIRMDRMLSTDRAELGRYALEPLRCLADGRLDPDSILNRPEFHAAPILLAGDNFGSGSSREPAVWALQALGLRCVIAPSFGDIFSGNCFQNGVLPLTLPAARIEAIGSTCQAGESVTIDLERRLIVVPGGEEIPFVVDPLRREALLQGLDEIGLTLKDDADIRRWQAHDRDRRPWIWLSESA